MKPWDVDSAPHRERAAAGIRPSAAARLRKLPGHSPTACRPHGQAKTRRRVMEEPSFCLISGRGTRAILTSGRTDGDQEVRVMARSASGAVAVRGTRHHWVRNSLIVFAVLAFIVAAGAILCTIY
jgi:hypothetical protein